MDTGSGWGIALGWNIVPRRDRQPALGTLFVALPLWYGLHLRAGGDDTAAGG